MGVKHECTNVHTHKQHMAVVFPGKLNWGESLCPYAVSQRDSQWWERKWEGQIVSVIVCNSLCVLVNNNFWFIVLLLHCGICFVADVYLFYLTLVHFSFFVIFWIFQSHDSMASTGQSRSNVAAPLSSIGLEVLLSTVQVGIHTVDRCAFVNKCVVNIVNLRKCYFVVQKISLTDNWQLKNNFVLFIILLLNFC